MTALNLRFLVGPLLVGLIAMFFKNTSFASVYSDENNNKIIEQYCFINEVGEEVTLGASRLKGETFVFVKRGDSTPSFIRAVNESDTYWEIPGVMLERDKTIFRSDDKIFLRRNTILSLLLIPVPSPDEILVPGLYKTKNEYFINKQKMTGHIHNNLGGYIFYRPNKKELLGHGRDCLND